MRIRLRLSREAIALQSDGKIIVAGYSMPDTFSKMVVARLNSDVWLYYMERQSLLPRKVPSHRLDLNVPRHWTAFPPLPANPCTRS